MSHRDRRRFFASAAAAEQAGYRPCLRCRPELAPGRCEIDAVPRLAAAAAKRVAAGALNGYDVASLAEEFGVSARHLRRAFARELGVSPVQLALTHRLLFAKRLLADTTLSVTHIAYASGFQSLRRFNAVCLKHYRMPPSALRRPLRDPGSRTVAGPDMLRLTLSYRAPLAWDTLLTCLARETIAGLDHVHGRRYSRTVEIEGRSGFVVAEDAEPEMTAWPLRPAGSAHLSIDVSVSLVPVLMPLLARLRILFDLDAEPSVVDLRLERGGLGALVNKRPGMRIPGAICGFEVAARILLGGWSAASVESQDTARRVVHTLGEFVDTGIPSLSRLFPGAERVSAAGPAGLWVLGVPRQRAEAIVSIARMVLDGAIHLSPGRDPVAIRRALLSIPGVGERAADVIVMRALSWPDVFPLSLRGVMRRAQAITPALDRERVSDWRPWRSYAALQLWAEEQEMGVDLASRLPAARAG